jgi:hypothetical protein
MTDIIAKIMVEVLLIVGLLSKEIGQGRASMPFPFDFNPKINLLSGRFLKKLAGKNDVEDALQRLEKMTQELAQMAQTEVLTTTCHNDTLPPHRVPRLPPSSSGLHPDTDTTSASEYDLV